MEGEGGQEVEEGVEEGVAQVRRGWMRRRKRRRRAQHRMCSPECFLPSALSAMLHECCPPLYFATLLCTNPCNPRPAVHTCVPHRCTTRGRCVSLWTTTTATAYRCVWGGVGC